ncbi:Os04g0534801, partial [Oryza sativa Japonica Group]
VRQIGREAGSGASPSRGGGGAAHPERATTHRRPAVLASLAPRDLAPAVSHLAPPFLFAPSSPPPSRGAVPPPLAFSPLPPPPTRRRRRHSHTTDAGHTDDDATSTTRPQATATPHRRHLKPHWLPHRHRCRADANASSSLAATVSRCSSTSSSIYHSLLVVTV